MAGTVRGTGKTFQTMVVFLHPYVYAELSGFGRYFESTTNCLYVMTAYPVTWLIGAVIDRTLCMEGKMDARGVLSNEEEA